MYVHVWKPVKSGLWKMEFHEQFATFHTRAREQLGKRKPIFIEMQVLLCTYNDRCIYILYIIRFRFICHVHKCNEIRCPQLQHITVTIQHVGTVQYNKGNNTTCKYNIFMSLISLYLWVVGVIFFNPYPWSPLAGEDSCTATAATAEKCCPFLLWKQSFSAMDYPFGYLIISYS